jgi:hypothetical protein
MLKSRGVCLFFRDVLLSPEKKVRVVDSSVSRKWVTRSPVKLYRVVEWAVN